MDISQLIICNKKERYELELMYTEDEKTKEQIHTIISKLEKPIENKIDKFDNKIDQIEILSMKKQFYRLKEPQKTNRIERYFIDKHKISNEKATLFANQVLELLNNSSIKSKDIDYDITNATINNINLLEISTKDDVVELKLIAKPKKIIKKKET
jgi:hypothetical protein